MCQLRDDAPTVARATMRPGVVRQPFSRRVRRYPVSLVRRTLHKAAHPPERPPHIPRTLEQRGACGGPFHASILHPVDSGACAGAQEQPFGAISPPSSKPRCASRRLQRPRVAARLLPQLLLRLQRVGTAYTATHEAPTREYAHKHKHKQSHRGAYDGNMCVFTPLPRRPTTGEGSRLLGDGVQPIESTRRRWRRRQETHPRARRGRQSAG